LAKGHRSASWLVLAEWRRGLFSFNYQNIRNKTAGAEVIYSQLLGL